METEARTQQNGGNNANMTPWKTTPPAFSEEYVESFFTTIEIQFRTAQIEDNEKKFELFFPLVPLNIQQCIPMQILAERDYEATKATLIAEYCQPKPALFDKMLTHGGVVYISPKQYLREISKIGTKLKLDDEFIKMKFIKALPDNIRTAIVAHVDELKVENLANLAETIYAYMPKNQYVNNVINNSNVHDNNDIQFQNDLQQHVPQINQSHFQQNSGMKYCTPHTNRMPFTNGMSRANSTPQRLNFRNTNQVLHGQQHGYAEPNIPVGIRSYSAGQKPKVCRAHLYFGPNARHCKPWCFLKHSPSVTNIQPSSRPNSPSPMTTNPSQNQPLN